MSKAELLRVTASAELDAAIAQAIAKASEAGMSREDVRALLERVVSLLEDE